MKDFDLDAAFASIAQARVAVLGDFCVDQYLVIDPDWKETSVETGKPVRGVIDQRHSPGGAGNVAVNAQALGVAAVHCLGCVGEDPHGTYLLADLRSAGCDVSGMATQRTDYATRAYVKPYSGGVEESRIDFGVANRISDATTQQIVATLERLLPDLDAVILNQQVEAGVWSEALFAAVERLAKANTRVKWIIDSRHHAGRFSGVITKFNACEAACHCGRNVLPDEPVTPEETAEDLERLFTKHGGTIVVTRGDRGVMARDATGTYAVPGIHVTEDVDPVGAGDTFCSALACALGADLDLESSLMMATWAASVTVRKLRQTGTASPQEIRGVASDAAYTFAPELADTPRRARRAEGLDLEIIVERSAKRVRFAIFDHDGTISTLRQGWEEVMEPMMVHAILGAAHDSVDERTFLRVVASVKRMIDATTGIATLQQMRQLVRMVEDAGFVPPNEVLDMRGYKEVYDAALMAMVNDRIARIARGELAPADFIIKGSVPLLQALRDGGISLVLASGTDQKDVQREAEFLGYADLFDGGIHGATGDPDHCSKRAVMESILGGRTGGDELLVCGDGPVEIREARRRQGIALGIASDEVRRYGLNLAKRARLIRAGADYIVPDWSQYDRMLSVMSVASSQAT